MFPIVLLLKKDIASWSLVAAIYCDKPFATAGVVYTCVTVYFIYYYNITIILSYNAEEQKKKPSEALRVVQATIISTIFL